MFVLEYAQFRNGRFVAWIDGGIFPSKEAAQAEAAARGLRKYGDDHLISGLLGQSAVAK